VWEAIPFSFVVDWFYRVQDFLQRYQEPLWPVTVTVMDFCVSYKVELMTKANLLLLDAACDENPNVHYMGYCRQKLYHRQRQLPNSGNAFINPGYFGPNQLALSASLLRTFF
jgi:hypothetical protein